MTDEEYWELHRRHLAQLGKYAGLLGKYDKLEAENKALKASHADWCETLENYVKVNARLRLEIKELKLEIETLTKPLPKEGSKEV